MVPVWGGLREALPRPVRGSHAAGGTRVQLGRAWVVGLGMPRGLCQGAVTRGLLEGRHDFLDQQS